VCGVLRYCYLNNINKINWRVKEGDKKKERRRRRRRGEEKHTLGSSFPLASSRAQQRTKENE
jgi:hypothetical protein